MFFPHYGFIHMNTSLAEEKPQGGAYAINHELLILWEQIVTKSERCHRQTEDVHSSQCENCESHLEYSCRRSGHRDDKAPILWQKSVWTTV